MGGYKGLCVFDVDNTITRGAGAGSECGSIKNSPVCIGCEGDSTAARLGYSGANNYPAVYGKQAIKQCIDNGMAVGVATFARCKGSGPAGVHSRYGFLSGMGLPSDVVHKSTDGSIHRGGGLQCYSSSTPSKGVMISNLMKRYGVSPQKTVFFDDQKRFLDQVAPTHAHLQQASKSCHGVYCPTGCGLSRKEFEHGFGKIHHRK